MVKILTMKPKETLGYFLIQHKSRETLGCFLFLLNM